MIRHAAIIFIFAIRFCRHYLLLRYDAALLRHAASATCALLCHFRRAFSLILPPFCHILLMIFQMLFAFVTRDYCHAFTRHATLMLMLLLLLCFLLIFISAIITLLLRAPIATQRHTLRHNRPRHGRYHVVADGRDCLRYGCATMPILILPLPLPLIRRLPCRCCRFSHFHFSRLLLPPDTPMPLPPLLSLISAPLMRAYVAIRGELQRAAPPCYAAAMPLLLAAMRAG